MNYDVFCVFDRVAKQYGEPFLCPASPDDAVAIRRFNYIASRSEMVADDLQLYKLGQMNIETGVIESNVEFICNYVKEA